MTARPRKFTPTHEITLERRDGTREVVPIQLVDGVGDTRVEWDSETAADWELVDGEWMWQGAAIPPGYVSCEVRRLGRGSDPRGPSKATERLTLNLRPDQLEQYRVAAGEVKVTRWAVRQLDAAVSKAAKAK
jgi:hypothetical protein